MASGKRYRAAVIGGSGYGGAEMIRRLLVHPDVELVRVASVDFVGEPLSAADPALEGLTPLAFENLAPAEAARGRGGGGGRDPEDPRRRRAASRGHERRLPAPGQRRVRALVQARAPVP